mgnify:FL=1
MTDQIIILVTDRGDSQHGEITVLESTEKAERLIETLLEAGFEQERIRVFTGADIPMQVSYRPVVEIPAAHGGERPTGKTAPAGNGDGHDAPVSKAQAPSTDAVSTAAHANGAAYAASGFRATAVGGPPANLRRLVPYVTA